MAGIREKIKADPRVECLARDPDGLHWIELKKGYAFDPQLPPYGGSHIIAETRLIDLVKHLDEIEPCACVDCSKK